MQNRVTLQCTKATSIKKNVFLGLTKNNEPITFKSLSELLKHRYKPYGDRSLKLCLESANLTGTDFRGLMSYMKEKIALHDWEIVSEDFDVTTF